MFIANIPTGNMRPRRCRTYYPYTTTINIGCSRHPGQDESCVVLIHSFSWQNKRINKIGACKNLPVNPILSYFCYVNKTLLY